MLNLLRKSFCIIFFINLFANFFIYIKISQKISAKYYQESKEILQKKNACERSQNLSKEEKGKKQQYIRECYKNLSKAL